MMNTKKNDMNEYIIKYVNIQDKDRSGLIFRAIIYTEAKFLETIEMTKEEDEKFCKKGSEYHYTSLETKHILIEMEEDMLEEFYYWSSITPERYD